MKHELARSIFSNHYLSLLNLRDDTKVEYEYLHPFGRGTLPNGVRFITNEGEPAFEHEEGFEEDWERIGQG